MKNLFATLCLALCLTAMIPVMIPVMGTAAMAAPSVNMRTGIHERHNRLVFDWNKKVEYTLQHDGNRVAIQFSEPATVSLRSLNAVRPPFIRHFEQLNNEKGLLVTFQVPDKARLESFRTNTGIAFDVLHMNKAAPVFSDPDPVPAAATPAPEQQAVPEDTPPVTVPQQTPIQEKLVTQEKPVTALQAELLNNRPAGLRTLADHLAGKPSQQELSSTAPTVSSDTEAKSLAVTQGTVIRLLPNEMTRLAVFARAGKLWLVLDKRLNTLTPRIEGEGLNALMANARRIDVKDGSAFVFDAPAGDVGYAIRRQKNEWQVWMNSPEYKYLPDDMPINIQSTDNRTSLSLYAGEEPVLVTVKDSLIGDRITVVPVRTPEGRIIRMRQTAEYQILPSYLGAAIIPRSDNTKIATENNRVTISAAAEGQDLRLSSKADRDLGIKESAFIPLFNLEVDDLPKGSVNFQRQQLEKRFLSQENAEDKIAVLLDMVRLNLRNGFGPEAEGLLRVVRSISPEMESSREYQALSGMAAALSGDLAKTRAELGDDALRSQPSARLWMGYALANHYEWPQAHASFIESGNALRLLPEKLQPRFILAQAETALMVGDIADADFHLKRITREMRLSPSEKAAYDYISATSSLAVKDREGSLPVYQELAGGKDRLYRVKAQMALTRQHVLDKKITLEEAIKDFERLRFEWRNDRLEIDILRQLGQYYIDNGQFMEGLSIWRQAASLSKNAEDTDAITETMQQVFTKLYVEGESKKLSPLQAVALFERFRELTPPGEAGNTALIHLADRLASVDLLDEAEALLEKQMRQHATGRQAAEMGAKLASWRLQNRNPSGAIKALDESAQDGSLPESLSEKRLLLRAKALADMNRSNEALALLNTVQSPQAFSLRADINWNQNRWAETAESLLPLINYYRDQGETAVDGPMPGLILKMAIAVALDDNRKGLELLTAQYGDYMNTTPVAQAFSLITKPSGDGSLADMETLTRQVGEVELFQKFLKDFGK